MQLGVIGNYTESTGWSQAITHFILSADTVIDTVCTPIRLNNHNPIIHPRLAELQLKKINCTHLVQYTLPNLMTYRGGVKNIGRFVVESDRVIPEWVERLNLMDELWVSCEHVKNAALLSGVKPPIHVVPENSDIERMHKNSGNLFIKEQSGNEFLFYFIGEITKRKNLTALIQAFNLEFDIDEPVGLVIKTYAGEPSLAREHVIKVINDIKAGMKVPTGNKEIVLTEFLSDEQMVALHKSCDCLVAPSYGEGWHRPAFDAMILGKTPIVTGWSAFTDYINNDNGWLVDYSIEPCFAHLDTFPELNTSEEQWAKINVNHLRACMREAYENNGLRKQKSIKGMMQSPRYTYKQVGNKIKELMNG